MKKSANVPDEHSASAEHYIDVATMGSNQSWKTQERQTLFRSHLSITRAPKVCATCLVLQLSPTPMKRRTTMHSTMASYKFKDTNDLR